MSYLYVLSLQTLGSKMEPVVGTSHRSLTEGFSGTVSTSEETTGVQHVTDIASVPDVSFSTAVPVLQRTLCDKINFAFYVIVLGVLLLVGLFGNTLTCVTFWSSRKKNATSFILIWLAFFDTGTLLVYFIMIAVPVYGYYVGIQSRFLAYDFAYMNAYVWPLGTSFHLASTWMVVLVTFNRFIAVCHPHKVKQYCLMTKTRFQVGTITVASFVFNIPRWVDEVVAPSDDGKRNLVLPRDFMRQQGYELAYNVVLYYLLICVIPFLMLLGMTYLLAVALRDARSRRQEMTRAKREEEDLTVTLVAIVVVFIVCQTPNPIRRAMKALIPPENRGCDSAYNYFGIFTTCMICVNSATNFILYWLFNPRFRRTFRHRLRWLSGRIYPESSADHLVDSGLASGSTGQQETHQCRVITPSGTTVGEGQM